jgi:hypothetical protein
MRELPPNTTLYQDAVYLPAAGWIEKYDVHPSYAKTIGLYTAPGGYEWIYKKEDAADSLLFQGWKRLFLLGTQISSEEVGLGGKMLAEYNYCNYSEADCKIRRTHNICETREGAGKLLFIVSPAMIGNSLKMDKLANTGHMPERPLDPYQFVLSAGLEEGLHATTPEIWRSGSSKRIDTSKLTADQIYELYGTIPGEIAIRKKLIAIHDELPGTFTYDLEHWNGFNNTVRSSVLARKLEERQAQAVTVTPTGRPRGNF